jgi:hypothetical protein
LSEIRAFLSTRLGFGDFILRTPEGEEYDRARDLRELEEKLKVVPEDVFAYHARHNHFSIWLMARSEFELAGELRPKKLSDFASVQECRELTIRRLRENRQKVHRGVISDFHPDHFEVDPFTRIGGGYLGGKARGLAFLYQALADIDPQEFLRLPVMVPQTIVVTTDAFDSFLEEGDLTEFAYACDDDEEIGRRFLSARLPHGLLGRLELIVERLHGPLAVRSSSLLEDSLHQPFAGIYSTLMIPNQDADRQVRLRELCNAVKLVYASTFFLNAKSYLAASGNRIEEEKMGVIIQRLVGGRRSNRFYPHFSGVAQSHNYYPFGPQKPEDGIVHLALGLGRTVADGGKALRFSPRYPQVTAQFGDPGEILDSSQSSFWALDMESKGICQVDLYSTLKSFDLKAAEEDGTLAPLASVYSANDNQIRDDLSLPGPRVITFNNILKHRILPLPEVLTKILEITQRGLGCAVEVEFACNMADWGRRVPRGRRRDGPELHLLQVRPLVSRSTMQEVEQLDFERDALLCSSERSLGHGLVREIRDIVYVRPNTWEASRNKAIAYEVGDLNKALHLEGRPYLLIGPGRWGTIDEWLGIPVQWSQISKARVIVEASPAGYNVDPSQGTHFFHNITAQGIGYLTIPPGADKDGGSSQDFVDWQWLREQGCFAETPHLRHLRLSMPLTVILDGKEGRGVIAKPEAEKDASVPIG